MHGPWPCHIQLVYVGYCSEGHGGCFVELYSEYITSKLFSLLVMDGGITHKALQALESINTFGIFKGISSANIYAHIPVHVEYLLYNAIELIEIKHASMSIALIFCVCCMLHTTYIALFYGFLCVSLYLVQNDFFSYYNIFALGKWCHGHQHWQHCHVLRYVIFVDVLYWCGQW